jgi:hypothetical protein
LRPLEEEPESSGVTRAVVGVLIVLLFAAVMVQVARTGTGNDSLLGLFDAWVAGEVENGAAQGEPQRPPPRTAAQRATDGAVGAPVGASQAGSARANTAGGTASSSSSSGGAAGANAQTAQAEASQTAADAESTVSLDGADSWDQIGMLRVRTEFPAIVYIDGKRIGKTPVPPVELTAGTHDVKVVPTQGGRSRQTRARVDGGRAGEVYFGRN